MKKEELTINSMPQRYLVDIETREQEAIQRLLELPFIAEKFFMSLKLSHLFSWYLLQMRKDRLVGSLRGDVDILAGRLNWSDLKEFESILAEETKNKPNRHPSWNHYFSAIRLADSGGIKWPPLVDYLVGIEAKCAYLSPQANQISADTIKSRKSSPQKVRHLRSQVKSLLRIGFNKVALLDIIANPPASGINGQAWLAAGKNAIASMDKMEPDLKERLPADSPAGHWVWPVGSIEGGDETKRSAGPFLVKMRRARKNPFLEEDTKVQSCRQEMEDKLSVVLANLPQPRGFPVIFIDCRNCGDIHRKGDTCKVGRKR